jgi:exopolyphosphatase / guanosine-5'-triphosphate,3'-diphosphate pyrophosphatase
MRIAVIDLGTNTFNLLIAEPGDKQKFNILFEQKRPVKLGKGGIASKTILPAARKRGMAVLKDYQKLTASYQVEKVMAFATSAIRSAVNGVEFTEDILDETGIRVEIISGDLEAEYIYHGICASVPLGEENVLILDIGGGSNEFIIGNARGIKWKHSYPLGMARIIEQFRLSDPVSDDDIIVLEKYFENQMNGLDAAVASYRPSILVGASGTFDTFASMLLSAKRNGNDNTTFRLINMNDYMQLHSQLLISTLAERSLMKGLEAMRIEMIVPASIFVNFVLRKYSIKEMIQTTFSLKEGVVAKLFNND